MSEHMAFGSQTEDAVAARALASERSRVAATSFRDLMSRMRKPGAVDVVVPAIDPLPFIQQPQEPAVSESVPACEEPVILQAEEHVLTGGFEENFTFVPEPGKEAEQALPVDGEDTLSQDLAERAQQLELENIWRLLLAKPTSEDLGQYLREAAEIHDDDLSLPAPAPEHDLSRVAVVLRETTATPQIPDDPKLENVADPDELARLLIGLMASGSGAGQPQERALASDTLLRLLPRLQPQSVETISRRVTLMDNPPQILVAHLIRHEKFEISGPLLEDCANIGDRDLLDLIEAGEPQKLRLIARRRKLSRTVCQALIRSGDPSAVLTLLRNAEAEIPYEGFQSLLVLCENNEELLAPLATRADMGAAVAFELFWLAPPQLRRFILSRHLTDSEALNRILKITVAANREAHHTQDVISQHALLDALDRAARGQLEMAAEELARLLKLSASTVTRILNDLSGEALVIMLKAAGYPRSAVTGLMTRMQSADLPVISRDRDVSELQIMFETLSFNKSRVLMTYWDWAQGKLGPYMPLDVTQAAFIEN
jgi:uncharacterized protein (DUF2336 family)